MKTSIRWAGALALAASLAYAAAANAAGSATSSPAAGSDNDPLSATATNHSCPVVSTPMKLGAANRRSDVLKLQAFLDASEHAGIALSGVYDEPTEAAVMAFQNKYAAEILGPWGATRATGVVNITTAKKVNQIACGVPLTLNGSELGEISAYRSKTSSSVAVAAALSASGAASVASSDAQAAADVGFGGSNAADASLADLGSTTPRLGGGSLVSRFFEYLGGWFR